LVKLRRALTANIIRDCASSNPMSRKISKITLVNVTRYGYDRAGSSHPFEPFSKKPHRCTGGPTSACESVINSRPEVASTDVHFGSLAAVPSDGERVCLSPESGHVLVPLSRAARVSRISFIRQKRRRPRRGVPGPMIVPTAGEHWIAQFVGDWSASKPVGEILRVGNLWFAAHCRPCVGS
jgi:hypothetical protein